MEISSEILLDQKMKVTNLTWIHKNIKNHRKISFQICFYYEQAKHKAN